MSDLETYRRSRPEVTPDESWRSPYERDADRILYSSAFRRLRNVTQVLVPGSYELTHDRLYHSLKVAQVGRRLAQILKHRLEVDKVVLPHEIDPDVVYAAGLAHDVGHPPFGHIGENELREILGTRGVVKALGSDERVTLRDSFEGNAQTFRLLTRVSFRSASDGASSGLNLTWATLAAVLKYPWLHGESNENRAAAESDKWGAFDCDESFLNGALKAVPGDWSRSIEASIMEWADDITYAVHDVEDFLRAGLLPMHELVRSKDEQRDFVRYCASKLGPFGIMDAYDESDALVVLRRVLAGGLSRSYRGGRLDKQVLHAWASDGITYFSDNAAIDASTGRLVIPSRALLANELMKQLVWYYVIDHPAVSSQYKGQRSMMRSLFESVFEWCLEALTSEMDLRSHQVSSMRRLPAGLLDLVALSLTELRAHTVVYESREERLARAVCDYICSLTESQAVELYRRLGTADAEPISGLGRWHIS